MSSWFAAAQQAALEAAQSAAAEAAKLGEQARIAAEAAATSAQAAAQKASNDLQEGASAFAQGVLEDDKGSPITFDFEFVEGPLGFKLGVDAEGLYMTTVVPGGQAAGHGVGVGDRLFALAGEAFPSPPAGITTEQGQQVVKAVTKQLRDQPRPVTLTFAFASGQQSEPAAPEPSEAPVPESQVGGTSDCAEEPLPMVQIRGALHEDDGDALIVSNEVAAPSQDEANRAHSDDAVAEGADVPAASSSQAVSSQQSGTPTIPVPESSPAQDVSNAAALEIEHNIAEATARAQAAEQSLAETNIASAEATARAEAAEQSLTELQSEFATFREKATQQSDGMTELQSEFTSFREKAAQQLDGMKVRAREMLTKEKEQKESLSKQLALEQQNNEIRTTELKKARDEATQATIAKEALENHLAANGETDSSDLVAAEAERLQAMSTLRAAELEAVTEASSLRQQLENAAESACSLSHEAEAKAQAAQSKHEDELGSLRQQLENAQELGSTLSREAEAKTQTLQSKHEDELISLYQHLENAQELGCSLSREAEAKAQALQSKHEDVLGSLRQQLENAQELGSSLSGEAEAKTQTLQSEHADVLAQLHSLQKDHESVQERLTCMTRDCSAVRSEMDGLMTSKAVVCEQLDAASAQIQLLQNEVQAAQEQSADADSDLKVAHDSKQQQIALLEAQVLQAQGNLSQQHADTETLQAQLADAHGMAAQQHAKTETLQAQLADAHSKLSQNNAETDTLQADRNKEAVLSERAQEQANLLRDSLESQIAQMEAEARTAKTQTEKQHAELSSAQEESATWQQRFEALQSDHEQKLVEMKSSGVKASSAQISLEQEVNRLNSHSMNEAIESATRSTKLNADLDCMRKELLESQQQAKQAQQASEKAQIELQEIAGTSSQRDVRVSAAHSVLETKMQGLQQQLSIAIQEKDVANVKSNRLLEQASAAGTQLERLQNALAQRDDEVQDIGEVSRTRVQELESKLASLNEALAAAELRAQSTNEADRQQIAAALESAATAQASADNNVKDVQDAQARAAEAAARVSRSEEDAAQAHKDAQGAREEADSHKQLIRSLQQQLGEQEKNHAVELDKKMSENDQNCLQQERAEALRQSALKASPGADGVHADKTFEQGECSAQAENAPNERGGGTNEAIGMDMGCADSEHTMPPEKAGQEETLALHERIEMLEKRCSTLQNKLSARPIIYQTASLDGPDPLLLEGGSQSAVSANISLVRRIVEPPLRNFTKRLLKRDAWLWVFYAHLLVLYAISGWSFSVPNGGGCVDMSIKEGGTAVAATPVK